VIVLTYEKVLEVFEDYLSKDDSCEILQSSRGPVLLDWNSGKTEWYSAQLCRTPGRLRDVLRSHFEEYQMFLLTDGYKREATTQQEEEIRHKSEELSILCEL